MSPPALAEMVLAGVMADAALEEEVLGDLAEEWAERASTQGSHGANRWYWREVVRTTPHLLLAWWRATSGRDFRRTLRAVACGFGVMAVLTTPGEALRAAILGAPSAALHFAVISTVTNVVVFAVVGFASGAVTARVARRASVANALAFAGSYLLLAPVLFVLVGATTPIAYWASLAGIVPGAVAVMEGRSPSLAVGG